MTSPPPPEWAPHEATWLAWPYRDDEWTDLEAARVQIAALVRAIAETERVRLLVHPALPEPPAFDVPADRLEIVRLAYGDAWTRDTLPLLTPSRAYTFRFDGWGGKYRMEGDEDLAARVAAHLGLPLTPIDLTYEGGGIEFDGAGRALVTGCLELRNPDHPDPRGALADAFGVEVLSFEGALRNDHTDGHVDTLARFVAPGRVVCMQGRADDPNGAMLLMVQEQLLVLGLDVVTIPSPGVVLDREGELMPASYCNYVLCEGQVLVPTYGSPHDEDAVRAVGALFPGRRARGLRADAILEGGGAFHCITQQQPR